MSPTPGARPGRRTGSPDQPCVPTDAEPLVEDAPPPEGPAPARRPARLRVQFLVLLVARVLGSALQAVALVLLARSVTPDVFGVVNAVIAVVGIVLVATGLGMSLLVPRARAAGDADEVAAGLRMNLWSNLATAVVLVVGLGLYTGVRDLPVGVLLIGLSLALERNVDTILGVPVADGDSRTPAASMLLRRTVSLLVLVPALVVGVDPVWAFTCGLLAGALAAQVHIRRVVVAGGDASAVPPGELLRRAAPFLVSNLSVQARSLDTAVVATVLGPAAAGAYAAAAKLVQPLLLVPLTLAGVVMPRAAQLASAEARRLARRLVVASLASGLVVLPVVVLAEPLVVLVMGEQYAGSGPVLAWSAAALPFIAMSASLGALLQGRGRERLIAVVSAAFAVLGLAGMAIGAAAGGIVAAAAALSVLTVVRCLVLGVFVVRLGRTPAS